MRYKQGDMLPELVKEPVSRMQLVKYAGASGDYNPIHYDEDAARTGGLEGIIAHGMLSMGFLGQFVENAFGAGNYKRLEVRFQGMVKLGEIITCRGIVTDITQGKDRSYATCEIEAIDSEDLVVTKGKAQAWLD